MVHYLGWKDRWDEEVTGARIRKFTEESVQLKEYLLNQMPSSQRKERGDGKSSELTSTEKTAGNTSGKVTAKKRKHSTEQDAENPEAAVGIAGSASVEEVPGIVFPSALKRQLVDDWEFITKEQKLVPLPREPTVSGVLSAWLHSKSRRGIADKASREVADGLRDYFDAALGTMLLYKFERNQYNTVIHKSKTEIKPSKVYGAEHLLRLLIKFPTLLDKADIEPSKLALITEKVNEFAKFLHKNGRIVFLPEYEPAGATYCAEAYNH